MKKITSLMMMLVLCCVGAFGQAATEWADKLIRIGVSQAEMVPGKWYFLHNSRMPNQSATEFTMPGETIPSSGGLAVDKGVGSALLLTATTVIDELSAEDGVNANDHMDKLVRFVAVEGVEGAYNIQFGTGNWLAASPANGTVNNNQYIAGQAGQYNFYLVTINGAPNEAGRFAWNKYNMANRVDNNGAGNGIVFWSEGETVAEGDQLNAEDGSLIKGNKIWQIYEVEDCGTVDPWESSLDALINTRNSINERDDYSYISNLQAGINVGNSYGNYRPEDVQAFLEYANRVEEILEEVDLGGGIEYLQSIFETVDDMKAYTEAYRAADEKVRANKIPLAVSNIAPGYYTINNVLNWYETKRDTIYYTQEECDQLNEEGGLVVGDEGYLTPDSVKEVQSNQVPAPIKSLCSRDSNGQGWLAWGTQQPKSDYLWKIEKVEGREAQYRLINMYREHTFNNLGTSVNAMLVNDDTVTVVFDYRDSVVAPVINEKVLTYSIRNTYADGGEEGYHHIHCGGHSNGAGVQSWVVGWSGTPEASRWYLSPVDDATANEWIHGDAAKVRQMVTEAGNIIGTVPAQIEVAKDIVTTLFENDSVVVTADQFYSQYSTNDAQTIPEGKTVYDFLIDGNQSTYWHSRWEDGNQPFQKHYLQINANETLEGLYAVKIARRPVAGDHITSLAVKGYETEPTDETTFEEGKDLGTLNLPLGANNETLVSSVFDATGCNYLRFYSLSTAGLSGGGSGRGYWHASEFNVFKAEQSTRYEKTQYEVRSEIISKLQAAMDAWTAAEYDSENAELINDEAFNAAYNTLMEAAKAWEEVYVDPAALRSAIADAPAEDLFVIGNNPGQWKEGSVTPAATVNNAQAYDETGAYTPAESEKWIKAIADVTTEAFAAANKVQTGKWYRIKFPTEEMYDNYGWDKTAAKNAENAASGLEVSPALFGGTVAAGKSTVAYETYPNEETGNTDTLATYHVELVDEFTEGNGMYFFNDEDIADAVNGEDLFRFIQATDSSYIIQNKATGLFLRGGHPASLSVVPSYFYANAIGAGANIVTYTDVLGETAQLCNLHGQRSDSRLVCWEANTIGSNSALLIEEAEDVTEEPSTEYAVKLWPGSVYAYTTPVDVTLVGTEAAAYGAQLVLGDAEGDTAVVLKKIEAETIKAGTPYILIANNDGSDYITPADRLKEIGNDLYATEGQYGYYEKQLANELLDEEYVHFTMDHGMEVDTIQKGNGDLVGTFRSLTVEAGKGIVTKNNGFAHTIINATVAAYGAYIKCDFDPESADVLGTIKVEFNGSIDTGINQVLDKVAKSGNIYTVDGKLVGKGNINTVNNLPAGIYIVNGVKVTKK